MKCCKIIITLLFLSSTLLCSCSEDNNAETKPDKIDTMTTDIAQEATRMIKTPLDKAQAVTDSESKRVKELEASDNQ